jgi:methionine-S-sulfoxide reductase
MKKLKKCYNAENESRGAEMNSVIMTFIAVLFIAAAPWNVFASDKLETATFAGGCFWCVQPVFDYLKGVKTNYAGYANGNGQKPTYEDYAENGYAEAVQVTFDPSQVSYETLLENFWMQIDPTDAGGQFVDRGPQYRPAIFFHSESQKKTALAYIAKMSKSGKYSLPIRVEVSAFKNFFPAELYHQEYHNKSPMNYMIYRAGSGRDAYIKKIWGKAAKPPDTEKK